MRVITTYKEILQTFSDGVFDTLKWRTYVNQISPHLPLKCEENCAAYDFHREVAPVLNLALHNKEKLSETNHSFHVVCKLLYANLPKLFHEEVDVDIILYLGLCNGAGWVTTLDGKNTILLGIEKIIELNWCSVDAMQGLIFHELGHIWHAIYGNLSCESTSPKEKSIRQLYQEGIAMVCEQILCENDGYFHQDKNGWLNWCEENETTIKNEYLNRLNNAQSTQDFFGDWCSYQGHSDVGYYLGCKFIKFLQSKYSLMEIANLTCQDLLNEFALFTK